MRLDAAPHLKRWTAPNAIPTSALLNVYVTHRGKELTPVDLSNCRAKFYGAGSVVSVNACRPHLRVRYISVGRARLRLTYARLPSAAPDLP